MGFPNYIDPEFEQWLDDNYEDVQREVREIQERREPWRRRPHWPRLEAALGTLIGQMHRSRGPLPEEHPARLAEIFRRDAIRTHMQAVAVRSHSPAELRMRLIRDGTIPDEPVIEELPRWEWLWLPRSR
jgi:hypothetical protein